MSHSHHITKIKQYVRPYSCSSQIQVESLALLLLPRSSVNVIQAEDLQLLIATRRRDVETARSLENWAIATFEF